MKINVPLQVKEIVHYRKIRDIDIYRFRSDLNKSLSHCINKNLNEHIEHYNSTFKTVLDQHAPIKTKRVSIRRKASWFTDELTTAKKARRRCERLWRRTRLQEHRAELAKARLHVNNVVHRLKTECYSRKIEQCGTDQKKLFSIVNDLLHTKALSPLPSAVSDFELANRFSNYFHDKIVTLRNLLDTCDLDLSPPSDISPLSENDFLHTFHTANESEISKYIKDMSKSTCDLDPAPTLMVKECSEATVGALTSIINKSMLEGIFPDILKSAIVKPLLKKASLDAEVLKNYRPVSNLAFLSKLLEKTVLCRILDHLKAHNLHEQYQSAYKQFHSTETALLKVQNDILHAIDKKQGIMLVLLDLSSAFDTIDHTVLLERLRTHYGIVGNALSWFRSYIDNRTQCVQIGNRTSNAKCLRFGVPQGSIMGPIIFILYTKPMTDICKRHCVSYHIYADDTQLYFAFDFPVHDHTSVSSRMEACIKDIKVWMSSNRLKINDDKTEFMVITSPYYRNHCPISDIAVGDSTVSATTQARNIGVIFDNVMNMDKQVAFICKSASYHLRNIRAIRKYLTADATKKLVHAFVTSRIDANNSLLYGIPAVKLRPLQLIQNQAAKLLVGARKFDHASPILEALHWLPVSRRIDYKILLLTFKALNGMAPRYLRDLLVCHEPSRQLRSSNASRLVTPRTRTRAGDRSFQAAAAKLWNSLPTNIRQIKSLESFKTCIKTHLFSCL